jgi:undecaprenyl-diphosphatase
LSRSGSTIFGGLLGGLRKDFAVRYAFILSIPAILGAGLLELVSVLKAGQLGMNPISLLAGFIAATLCGILAIQFIKLLIKNKKFYIFGIYCLCASAVAFLVGFGVIRM